MLIRELIALLSTFDPDLPVSIGGQDSVVAVEREGEWTCSPERSVHHPRWLELNPPIADAVSNVTLDKARERFAGCTQF